MDSAAVDKAIGMMRAVYPAIESVPTGPTDPRMPGMLKGLIVPDALFDPLEQEDAARRE